MKDLINNIETAINNQVIEAGKFEDGLNYFEAYELESGGNVYFADFFISVIIGKDNEQNDYEIEVTYVGINLENGVQDLYPKVDLFETLAEISNPK